MINASTCPPIFLRGPDRRRSTGGAIDGGGVSILPLSYPWNERKWVECLASRSAHGYPATLPPSAISELIYPLTRSARIPADDSRTKGPFGSFSAKVFKSRDKRLELTRTDKHTDRATYGSQNSLCDRWCSLHDTVPGIWNGTDPPFSVCSW